MSTRFVWAITLYCGASVGAMVVPRAAHASKWENVKEDTRYTEARPQVVEGKKPEAFSYEQTLATWRSAALRQLSADLWPRFREAPGKTLAAVIASQEWTQKKWGNRRVIGARLRNAWRETKGQILEPLRNTRRAVDRLETGFGLNKRSQVSRGGNPLAGKLHSWASQVNLRARNGGLPQLPFGKRYSPRREL